MSRIKIVSDGTPSGTIVYDAEGKTIKGIVSVSIDIDARTDHCKAYLMFNNPSVEYLGEKFEPQTGGA